MRPNCFVKKSTEGEAVIPLEGATIYFAPIEVQADRFPHPRAGLAILGPHRERSRLPQRLRLDCAPWDITTASDPLVALEAAFAWLVVRHGVKQEHIDALLAGLTVEHRDVALDVIN